MVLFCANENADVVQVCCSAASSEEVLVPVGRMCLVCK
jgi:hypothetical protein